MKILTILGKQIRKLQMPKIGVSFLLWFALKWLRPGRCVGLKTRSKRQSPFPFLKHGNPQESSQSSKLWLKHSSRPLIRSPSPPKTRPVLFGNREIKTKTSRNFLFVFCIDSKILATKLGRFSHVFFQFFLFKTWQLFFKERFLLFKLVFTRLFFTFFQSPSSNPQDLHNTLSPLFV